LIPIPANLLKSTGVNHGVFPEVHPTTISIAKPESIEFKDEPIADYYPNVNRSIRNNRAQGDREPIANADSTKSITPYP
jgi:hypothetical protein